MKLLRHCINILMTASLLTGCMIAPCRAQPEKVSSAFDTRTEIDTSLEAAHVSSLAGDYDTALVIYRETFRQSFSIYYKYGMVRSLLGLGVSEVNLGSSNMAMGFFEQALHYCDTSDETGGLIATIYNNMANIHYLRGEHAQAVRLLEKAVSMRERIPSRISLSSIYINLSNILNSMSRPDLAEYYLDKAETEAGKSGDPVVRANVLHSRGSFYIRTGKWSEAKRCFEEAVALGKQYGYDDILYSSMVNLADIALGQDAPRQAMDYIHTANATSGNIAPFYRSGAMIILARAQLQLHRYADAENSLQAVLAVSKDIGEQEAMLNAYRLLHRVYAERGAYDRAYAAMTMEKKLSDSLSSRENTEAVMRIEARYRTAQKDKEIAEKQLLISRQENDIRLRNIWIILAAGGLVISALVILLLRGRYRHNHLLEQQRVRDLIREQELHKMKAIMEAEEKERSRIARDLHDGIMIQFSTVKMNMSALTGGSGPDIKKEQLESCILQLDKATQSLRKAAHHLMPDMLLEEGLAEAVHYFLNSLRQDVPFTIIYDPLDTIPRFDIEQELAVYRMIQELVQNVIKHAHASELYVQLSYSDKQLGIDIEDDGIGMDASPGREHGGTGLKSAESRVAAMNGSMQVKSGPEGTCISLEFELDHR